MQWLEEIKKKQKKEIEKVIELEKQKQKEIEEIEKKYEIKKDEVRIEKKYEEMLAQAAAKRQAEARFQVDFPSVSDFRNN